MSGIKIIQIGMDEALEIQKKSDDEKYDAFVDKFKPKLTTDDCYTPTIVFDAIKDWVCNRYGVDPDKTLRPFRPGGDYEHDSYPIGWTVLDNPPFSILSQIVDFYMDRDIPFFLYAPSLTTLSKKRDKLTHICTATNITYENGAEVNTSFLTNLDGKYEVMSAPDLQKIVAEADKRSIKEKKQAKQLPKYSYPDHILTAAMVNYLSVHGIDFNLPFGESVQIRAMDAQRKVGKSIFGAGFLLSEKAAAEKAAAEKAAAEKAAAEKWKLSDREWAIVRSLGK